jgi:hypothetical protein
VLPTACDSSQIDERQKAKANLRPKINVMQVHNLPRKATFMEIATLRLVQNMNKELNIKLN